MFFIRWDGFAADCVIEAQNCGKVNRGLFPLCEVSASRFRTYVRKIRLSFNRLEPPFFISKVVEINTSGLEILR